MYHWIRDCAVDVLPVDSYNHGNGESYFIFYHFLRTAGWSWIWECDGDADTHCTDASMEAAGIGSWTAVGSTVLNKSTSQKHMGTQGLSVNSISSGDGVRSAALVSMSNSVEYRLTLWAYNDTGQAWDVQVDTGTGSFSSIGSIPSDGAWTQYDFSFTTHTSGTRYFQVLDTNASIGTLYLDSVILRRSWFEYSNGVIAEDFSGSPDGQILNDFEFHSASHSFSAADIDRYLCIWDPTNLGNTGVYKIYGVNGTDAQMDLRAGGSPALVAQTGLRWRLVDITGAALPCNGQTNGELYAGFGLESPHAEKWRLFMRHNWRNAGGGWANLWSSPYDADFDVETGNFLSLEVSTLNVHPSYARNSDGTDSCVLVGHWGSSSSTVTNRLYLQTDDTGSFLIMGMRGGPGSDENYSGWYIGGFTGSDSYHTLRESFVSFARSRPGSDLTTTIRWEGNGYDSTPLNGAQVGYQAREFGMKYAAWMSLGFSASSDITDWDSIGRPNPFGSPTHILLRPKIARDYWGYTAYPTEKLITTMGLWYGVPNNTGWGSIESNSYLDISFNGVYLEMPSSGGVGLFEPLT